MPRAGISGSGSWQLAGGEELTAPPRAGLLTGESAGRGRPPDSMARVVLMYPQPVKRQFRPLALVVDQAIEPVASIHWPKYATDGILESSRFWLYY